MLRDSLGAGCPHVEKSVGQLLQEDSLFDQNERRSFHREFLFRPVVFELSSSGERLEGYSRNISYLGLSAVTRVAVPPSSNAKIEVYRLNSDPSLFIAECRWSLPYGEDWFVSGWNFLNFAPSRAR